MSDDRQLVVLLDGRRAGLLTTDSSGRLGLRYDEAWRSGRTATPVSLSMPLAQAEHGDAVVRPFLQGMLPDNERVLERWARTYHVSAGNPFALLRHVGEDCAGAVQFVRPERVESVLAGDGRVAWLDEAGVAQRLRILRQDPTAWHADHDGRFSLAGAQAKIALYRDPATGRWGVPTGATPTTHILKPAVSGLDDHDLNEHLCLTAAGLLGIAAADTAVESFGAERVIVVQRYDRVVRDGEVRRVHQEDVCQALGVRPDVKYQNEGGPTPETIIDLLRRNVMPAHARVIAVDRFVDALALNWIVGGTDAHGKNYSVLLSGTQVRLSPLYDVASALPYEGFHLPKLRMAMKIGGEYVLQATTGPSLAALRHRKRARPRSTHGENREPIDRPSGCAGRGGAGRRGEGTPQPPSGQAGRPDRDPRRNLPCVLVAVAGHGSAITRDPATGRLITNGPINTPAPAGPLRHPDMMAVSGARPTYATLELSMESAVIVVVVILVAAGLTYLTFRSMTGPSPRRSFARMPVTAAADVATPGAFRLVGRVVAVGEPPVSEASGRPYVARDLRIVPSAGDSGSTRPAHQAVDFLLDDGTATTLVRARDAVVSIDRDFTAPRTTLDKVPWIESLLRAGGYTNGSPATCTIRFYEGVLPPGAHADVLGYAEVADAQAAALGATRMVSTKGGVQVMIRPGTTPRG